MFGLGRIKKIGPDQDELLNQVGRQRQEAEELFKELNKALISGGSSEVSPQDSLPYSVDRKLTDKKGQVSNTQYSIQALEAKKLTLEQDLTLQRQMPSKAMATFSPSLLISASTIKMMAQVIGSDEIVHSNIFDIISQNKDQEVFDIALERTSDINKANSRGFKILLPTCNHLFEYGIRALLKNMAITNDTFIALLRKEKIESAKLLVQLTEKIVTCYEIFTGLVNDSLLINLDLSNVGLGPDGFVFLCESLRYNKHLSKINLSKNNASEKGAQSLAQVLATNQVIQDLNLASCNIGFVGVKHLAEALEGQNKVLRKINLSSNQLNEEGALVLTGALDKESKIFELDISDNNISDVGAIFIIDTLFDNNSLKILNLSKNNISNVGIESLWEVISHNNAVAIISLDKNRNLSDVDESITKALSTNSSILSLTGFLEPEIAQKCLENKDTFMQQHNLHDLVSQDEYSTQILAKLTDIETI
jgi:Ran GTPase-activating protein (RanGAP) involved in mRNA processing and transport